MQQASSQATNPFHPRYDYDYALSLTNKLTCPPAQKELGTGDGALPRSGGRAGRGGHLQGRPTGYPASRDFMMPPKDQPRRPKHQGWPSRPCFFSCSGPRWRGFKQLRARASHLPEGQAFRPARAPKLRYFSSAKEASPGALPMRQASPRTTPILSRPPGLSFYLMIMISPMGPPLLELDHVRVHASFSGREGADAYK